MNLLWLIVSGEFGERLSQDLRAAGYAITEVASTGDFLNFGNMILLLSVEKREVDAATALIRQKMNEYRHLDAFDQDALPGSDIAIYDIPLYQYAKVGKGLSRNKKSMRQQTTGRSRHKPDIRLSDADRYFFSFFFAFCC